MPQSAFVTFMRTLFMNVLIINLTRFGDLLQTQPVILGLKAQGHAVGLICLENFASATVLLQGLDYVYPIRGATILSALEQAGSDNNTPTWTMAIFHVEELIRHVAQHFPVDMVVNTTATLSSRLLARRLTSMNYAKNVKNDEDTLKNIPILGFGLDVHGFGESGDMWTTFLQGASAERLNCPFNLVDMFRSVAKVTDFPALRGLRKPEENLQQKAQRFLNEQKPNHCQGFVAFQLGASEPRRQWPVQHFAQLGTKLWQELKLCPVLFGSKTEQELGQNYAHMLEQHKQEHKEISGQNFTDVNNHPFINLIGKTDILHLAAFLNECSLIVSNDTGTMHLAAGLDVPVIGIFLSTAQVFDTGPYMQNACCLEPALACHPCAFQKPCIFEQNQPCLQSINAELVGDLAKNYLLYGQWNKDNICLQERVRIWESVLEDTTGFINFKGLSGHEKEERSHWLHLQRYFYRHILDDKLAAFTAENHFEDSSDLHENHNALSNASATIMDVATKELAEHVAGLSDEFKENVTQSLEQCTNLLLLLQENMQLIQRMPSKLSGARIVGICNTIYGVLEKCPPLKALGHLWLVLYQERGDKWENFSELVFSLRSVLLFWNRILKSS